MEKLINVPVFELKIIVLGELSGNDNKYTPKIINYYKNHFDTIDNGYNSK